MSRARSGKKKSRSSGARPAARRPSPPKQQQQQQPPLGAQILPGGEAERAERSRAVRPAASPRGRRETPRVERVETEEKNFYGETAVQMLGRVRRELLHIVVLAAVSFAVGILVVQFARV